MPTSASPTIRQVGFTAWLPTIRSIAAESPTQSSYSDDWRCRIQAPEVIRIAGHDVILPLPGEDYHRRVDNIRRIGGAAQLSTGTGKLLVKRNDLNFFAPQES